MDIALVTYSTKPRGGVVHTLSLAEALWRQDFPVHVIALGDPAKGFFRHTSVPHTIISAPERKGTLEERVFAAVDTIAAGLSGTRFDILHTQDCISARAAARVRDHGAPVTVFRTVHHVDDFTSRVLIDCQRQAIIEPDRLFVVSEQWRSVLRKEYGVRATVIRNGVDPRRFGPITLQTRRILREQAGVEGKFVFLSVGGVEPRKGSTHLFEALAKVKQSADVALVVIGGESFQDYQAYRDAAFASLPGLGLQLGKDIVVLGTVEDAELRQWYRAADALAFPSTKEGFGLTVLEAMSADLPVVTSDLPVFREYLNHGENALLSKVGDSADLAAALLRIASEPGLRTALRANAHRVLRHYTWEAAATRHRDLWLRQSRC